MLIHRSFAVGWLLAFAVATHSVADESRREPVLTVLGRGSYEIKPDMARFKVSVTTDSRTLDGVGKPHEERATRALRLLKALAEDDVVIDRSSFGLDERRAQRLVPPIAAPGQPQKSDTITEGFRANTTFHLTAGSVEKLNVVISKLAGAGLFEIGAVRFQVANERAALNQARRAAVIDAREQAQAYAEPVGLNLEQIVAVTDGEAEVSGQADLPSRRATGTYYVQVVPPATVQFTASVNVTWRIGIR